MNADDRIQIRPSQQFGVVLTLMNAVAKASNGGASVPAAARDFLKAFDEPAANEQMAKVASQLWANRGKSIVVAGGLQTQTEDAADLQAAVSILNSMLGNNGQTVDYENAFRTRQGSSTDLAALIADMNAGKVKTLIIHNLNPVYALPTDAAFAEALGKVAFVVSTANRNDETAKYANYVIPAGTSLEAWGDYELQTGLYSIQQPTIRPLHDSRSFEESLLAWTKAGKGGGRAASAEDWFSYVQGTWKEIQGRSSSKGLSFEDFWNLVLQQGVVSTGNRELGSRAGVAGSALPTFSTKARTKKEGYELVLYPTVQLGDGRYANIAWMQELPDPVTKVVWDNYVSIAPATAEKEHLKQGDVVVLKVGTKRVKAPVHIQPGIHPEVFALSIGYGRTEA
ncbi:MAG: molybdopterin-dependent oxidoreductase, partial [Bdellovibrionota bacterium]